MKKITDLELKNLRKEKELAVMRTQKLNLAILNSKLNKKINTLEI